MAKNNVVEHKRPKLLNKYDLGQVVPLRWTGVSMPSRLIVVGMSMKATDTEWYYDVKCEHTGNKISTISESWIDSHKSNQTASVYKNEEVKLLIANGYLWVGNYLRSTALEKMDKLKEISDCIDRAVCIDALDRDGKVIKDKYGVWIRYTNIIKKEK